MIPTAGPVAADCASDATQWPLRPRTVNQHVFSGRVIGTDGAGALTFQVLVDRVYAGDVPRLARVKAWCVEAPFRVGERYLVATSNLLDLPDYVPSDPVEELVYTDGQAVAWVIPNAGKVRLTDFGDGASQAVPNYLKSPETVSQALRALRISSPGASPSASRAAEVAFPWSIGLAIVDGILAGVWTVTAAALAADS